MLRVASIGDSQLDFISSTPSSGPFSISTGLYQVMMDKIKPSQAGEIILSQKCI